ncbi:MAG: SprT family zinc-dependent metalloprotease [Atribacterota bacterium]|nr:SprT family zinc-dependent metalloprotease [Atribacterota bacterium]
MANNILVSGIEIEVKKKNIKNMHLSVLPPDGKVRISAPLRIKDEAIRLFAITKIGWIRKQITKFENQPRQTEREYIGGESHYVWGRRYRLEINYYNHGRNNVEIRGNRLILTVREVSSKEQREMLMTEWYRKLVKEKALELIGKWGKIIGVKAQSVQVRNMLTRWGSCNVRKVRICVNLQLAKKPVECLEYVVVHELVHLLEKGHNSIFVGYMDEYLPDWRIRKNILNGFIRDRYVK